MSAEQIAAPDRRRSTRIAVALLLVAFALALGMVTAVGLFPARATERAADAARSLVEFRASERASLNLGTDPTKHGPPGR